MNKWTAYAWILGQLALCMFIMGAAILWHWGRAAYREWWL